LFNIDSKAASVRVDPSGGYGPWHYIVWGRTDRLSYNGRRY